MNIQETVENLLRALGREHVEQLLSIMRDNGYYRVGCHRHHRSQGGLAQHSLEVLMRMQRLNYAELPLDSIIVVALLHDLCNIRGLRQYRHHGSRSVLIATREAGFKLRPMEYQAILWHMHGPKEKGKLGAQFDEVLNNPLWQQLRAADGYSAAHPQTRENFLLALSGKSRRRTGDVALVTGHASCARTNEPKSIPTVRDERTLKPRKSSSYFNLMKALKELNMERNEAIEILMQDEAQRTKGPIVENPHYRGFAKDYLRTATADEIDNHRAMLMDKCQYNRCAAKYVAMYIYDETRGIFNHQLQTNEMYTWLKEEFNINSSLDNFYKERPKYNSDRR